MGCSRLPGGQARNVSSKVLTSQVPSDFRTSLGILTYSLLPWNSYGNEKPSRLSSHCSSRAVQMSKSQNTISSILT